ncbi:hypothetical protein [Mycobacterium sp. C31M]
MYLRIDTTVVPPAVEVVEPEDFTSFKVVLVTDEHSWVDPDDLTALAGRTDDPQWRQQLAGMIDYAGAKGWLDGQGRIRAHVEVHTP